MLSEHRLSVFGNPYTEGEASLAFLFWSGGWGRGTNYAVWVPQLSGGVRLGSLGSVSWLSCWGGADSGPSFMAAARGHQAARQGQAGFLE